MQKNDHNQIVTNAHRKVRTSTTLNRRYVSRPKYNEKVSTNKVIKTQRMKLDDTSRTARSSKIKRFNDEMSSERMSAMNKKTEGTNEETLRGTSSSTLRKKSTKVNIVSSEDKVMETPQTHPMQVAANRKMRARSVASSGVSETMSAKEVKEQAIQKALASASRSAESEQPSRGSIFSNKDSKRQSKMQNYGKIKFGFGRVVLALSCAAAAVFAIIYFVNLNMPDLSLKVAAMQTGIQATYPNYVPRDYTLSDIASEDGRVTLNFRSTNSNNTFSIVEEGSSWDSNALMTNYVTGNYSEDYTVLREQGITIYIDNNDACWVNGGVLYKLTATAGSLSKKQIKSIATSL